MPASRRGRRDAGEVVAVISTDRASDGPLLTYPSSSGPGGSPTIEHWILDNFKKDPWAGQAMVDTAEAVAAEAGIERGELDELTLLRYEQYEAALADEPRSNVAGWCQSQSRVAAVILSSSTRTRGST